MNFFYYYRSFPLKLMNYFCLFIIAQDICMRLNLCFARNHEDIVER